MSDQTPHTVDHVKILTTGGTIACTTDRSGALIPTLSGEQLLDTVRDRFPGEGVRLSVQELDRLDSSSMTLADIDRIVAAVGEALADETVTAVVLTHGTDSLEETAAALALFHDDERPVILTGAMRPANDGEPDGPGNLADAIVIGMDPASRGLGVLVVLGHQVMPALGTVKTHTSCETAFSPATTTLAVNPVPAVELAGTTIEVIAAYPGASRRLIDAAVSSGVDGIVVEALGAGNVGIELGAGVKDALAAGVPVVMSTRVVGGPVVFDYGGSGGGASLGACGATSAGWLRSGQARIVLAAALAGQHDPGEFFHRITSS